MASGSDPLSVLLDLLPWAVVVGVLGSAAWLVSKPAVRHELFAGGGYGLFAAIYALSGFAAMAWAGSLSGLAGSNALLAVLAVVAGLLVMVVWGVVALARRDNLERRRVLLAFLLLAASPVVPLVSFLLG